MFNSTLQNIQKYIVKCPILYYNALINNHLITIYVFTKKNKSTMNRLQYLPSNPSTGFRIRQCMMVVLQMVATGFGNDVQLMVGQTLPEMFPCRNAGAMELVIRIVHLVGAEDGLQTSFVK